MQDYSFAFVSSAPCRRLHCLFTTLQISVEPPVRRQGGRMPPSDLQKSSLSGLSTGPTAVRRDPDSSLRSSQGGRCPPSAWKAVFRAPLAGPTQCDGKPSASSDEFRKGKDPRSSSHLNAEGSPRPMLQPKGTSPNARGLVMSPAPTPHFCDIDRGRRRDLLSGSYSRKGERGPAGSSPVTATGRTFESGSL